MRLTRLIFPAGTVALATACALRLVVPATAGAQQPAAAAVTQQGRAAGADSARVDSAAATAAGLRSRPPIMTRGDLLIAGALTATAVALIPADARIARELQRPGPQSSVFLRETAQGAELIASPGALVVGGSLYLAGVVTRNHGVADAGWHTLEALAVSGQLTTGLKALFGRTRPYAAAGDAQDFDFGGGFGTSTRRSFPSGHTSAAFTLAAVMAEETSHRWPRAHRVIAPLAYAAATSVGLARMYHDKHWASDVALGAAIGTVSGRMVVRYAHGRPRNLIDRIALWPVRGR